VSMAALSSRSSDDSRIAAPATKIAMIGQDRSSVSGNEQSRIATLSASDAAINASAGLYMSSSITSQGGILPPADPLRIYRANSRD
jgi:hypothetical protein